MTTNQNKRDKVRKKQGKEKNIYFKKEKPASDWAAHHSVQGKKDLLGAKMVAGFPSIWPKVNLPDGGSRNKKQDA
jgi:hypothetical protein